MEETERQLNPVGRRHPPSFRVQLFLGGLRQDFCKPLDVDQLPPWVSSATQLLQGSQEGETGDPHEEQLPLRGSTTAMGLCCCLVQARQGNKLVHSREGTPFSQGSSTVTVLLCCLVEDRWLCCLGEACSRGASSVWGSVTSIGLCLHLLQAQQ